MLHSASMVLLMSKSDLVCRYCTVYGWRVFWNIKFSWQIFKAQGMAFSGPSFLFRSVPKNVLIHSTMGNCWPWLKTAQAAQTLSAKSTRTFCTVVKNVGSGSNGPCSSHFFVTGVGFVSPLLALFIQVPCVLHVAIGIYSVLFSLWVLLICATVPNCLPLCLLFCSVDDFATVWWRHFYRAIDEFKLADWWAGAEKKLEERRKAHSKAKGWEHVLGEWNVLSGSLSMALWSNTLLVVVIAPSCEGMIRERSTCCFSQVYCMPL